MTNAILDPVADGAAQPEPPHTQIPPGSDFERRVLDFSRRPMPTPAGPSDDVNHPAHYTRGGIECIDAIEAAVAGKRPEEAVLVANVMKYVWRYEDKDPVSSLRKAQWYLDRLLNKVRNRVDTYADGK